MVAISMVLLRRAGLSVPVARRRSRSGSVRRAVAPLTVTVIVPAHNEATTIDQTVRSCLAQSYPIQQVIVVADNCPDCTAEIACRAGATVIVGKCGSKAAAQNLALPYVTGDVVVAIDGDATLNTPAVALMVDTISAGCVGTCPAPLPKDTRTIYSQYRTMYHAIANGWTRRMQDVLGRQLVLSGMANCHRTDVLRQLGGFPDDTITEDFNLTWALHRRGYRVAFTPGAVVYTQEPTSLGELVSQLHRWTAGFAQTMVKQRGPLLDGASLIVAGSQITDALIGGLATCSFVPFIVRQGPAGLWTWWNKMWLVVTVASIGVAIQQVGWRTTLKRLPGWFALQTMTGPLTTWWLFREWVLGRHLTTWTGRHGCRAAITPMSPSRKAVLAAGAAVVGVVAAAGRGRAAPR